MSTQPFCQFHVGRAVASVQCHSLHGAVRHLTGHVDERDDPHVECVHAPTWDMKSQVHVV